MLTNIQVQSGPNSPKVSTTNRFKNAGSGFVQGLKRGFTVGALTGLGLGSLLWLPIGKVTVDGEPASLTHFASAHGLVTLAGGVVGGVGAGVHGAVAGFFKKEHRS